MLQIPQIKAKPTRDILHCEIPCGHTHVSQKRARNVIPVKSMTSVRAWACPKMFSRVVGFRRSAGLCDEIIHLYPWGKQQQTACLWTEVIRLPAELWNGVFGETPRGSLSDRFFPEWCRIPGLGGTGPASKSDWQVKKIAYGACFYWSQKRLYLQTAIAKSWYLANLPRHHEVSRRLSGVLFA